MVREGVTRREALTMLGGATAVGLAGCSADQDADITQSSSNGTTSASGTSDSAAPNGDERPAELPLIDVHIHLTPEPAFDREPFRTDAAINWMDENGVDKAIVHPLESPTAWSYPVPSWWVLREVANYPDRLIPFASVGPQQIERFGIDQLQTRIKTYLDAGARGIGELKAPLAIDHEYMQVLYELCATHDVPLLFHIDETNATDEIGLSGFESMLGSYPDTTFIAHGPGWWSQLSKNPTQFGGYPTEAVDSGGPVPRLLTRYDNLYGDLSGGSGWNALARDMSFAQEFLTNHAEDLMFGTDKLSTSKSVDQFALFETFDLSRNQWAAIRYQNIEQFL
ncbi:amidohydrolase family protein [Halocatena halophila]|uniref:amidohydrolase family protein n=1 Tax=Halocatena halophila TaxID=2814576 RepID=UPI002ED26BD6